MQTLHVNIPNYSYPIYIGNQLNVSELLKPVVENKQVMVVTNTTVEPLYLADLKSRLTHVVDVKVCVLPDGEEFKNQESINKIYDSLMKAGFNRDCVLIALGGGVIGDMTGFAAASFQRGVDFVQIPTTLLSQVDSSVGGKTGINHALGKNMIGAFKQPKMVIINTKTLTTLPKREVSAGLAEIIKYALITDTDFLYWLETNMEDLVNLDMKLIGESVYRSCQHKSNIVVEDEFEAGRRALLNLGHTFGHAIENHMGYGEWLHGEAVGFGMLQAAFMSYLHGWLSEEDVNRVRNVLIAANLPVESPDMSVDDALSLMMRDKKVKSGKVRLILLKALGNAFITSDFDQDKLVETLSNPTCSFS